MSTVARAFENGKAFIPFITCGDPDLETTEQLIYATERAGADLIELGIPFSDPTAEGPVIQEANIRSLSAGTTTDKVFDLVQKVRAQSVIPLAFMTYANVIFSYGIEAFAQKAAEVGIDSIILPDVPFEEADEFDVPFAAVGFGISTPEQARNMAAQSDGAIVGSAIVKLCAQYGKDCVPYIEEYVRSMKEAVNQVR